MTALLFGLLLGPQDIPVETVDIAGRGVPLVFPDAAAPCGPWTAHIESGGFKYEVTADGGLGRKYVQDGGWGDIKARWNAAKGATGRRQIHIKVIVPSRVYILDYGNDGIVKQRRGFIERSAMDTIYRSLALLKAMIDGSSEGTVDTRFLVEEDDDPRFVALGRSGNQLSDEDIVPNLKAMVNGAAFPTDDGVYHGPYMGVFVIHAGLSGTARDYDIGHTPVTFLPYFGLDGLAPDDALAATMYRSFRRHVGLRRTGLEVRGRSQVTAEPMVDGGPTWKSWLETPETFARFAMSDRAADAAGYRTGPGQTVFALEHADLVLAKGASLVRDAKLASQDPSIVVSGAEGFDPRAIAVAGSAVAPQSQSPRGVGLHEVKLGDEAGTFVVTRQGRQSRGYASFPLEASPGVSFRAKPLGNEGWYATAVASDGKVAERLILGIDQVPGESEEGREAMAPLASGNAEWQDVTVTAVGLGLADIVELRIGAGSDSWMFERDDPGPASLTVTAPSGTQAAATPTLEPLSPDSRLVALAAIQAPASPEDVALITSALASQATDLKINALAAIAKAQVPGFLAELNEQARGALASTSYLAIQALAARTDPESQTILFESLERAPFDHGRKFVLEAFRGKFADNMAAAVSQMGVRSWSTRLAGVLSLGAMAGQPAQILLATSVPDEPNPAVRLAAVKLLDPKVGLVARRLQYTAVNDPSEAVRVQCLAALLDSEDRGILRDAHNGVRDESPVVRLELLARIEQRRNDADRPALRLAVTDPMAVVRARALRAFLAQPGPVKPEEVANTKDDPDPMVRAAYTDLAKTKGF